MDSKVIKIKVQRKSRKGNARTAALIVIKADNISRAHVEHFREMLKTQQPPYVAVLPKDAEFTVHYI